ncbi:MAG: hypothetical protein EHM93_10070 [Bacteroidales bacterium]|nr:MAG: hypothetical protein EHM93_10070 [Bacteroidales bacterium]
MLSGKRVKYCLLTAVIVILVNSCSLAVDLKPDTSKINSILANAKFALDTNNLLISSQLSGEALTRSINAEYIHGKAKSLLLIGQILSKRGMKDSSMATFNKSLLLFQEISDELGASEALYCIGVTFSEISNPDSAEFYFNRVIEKKQRINDRRGVALAVNNLGSVYTSRGIYSKAIEYYFLSLTISEEIGDKLIQARALNNIGLALSIQGDNAKALEFYLKSLKIINDIKDLTCAGAINNNIGNIYQQTGDYELATKYYLESLRVRQSQNDSLGISFALNNLGDIYQIKGKYSVAIDYFHEAENIKKNFLDYSSLAGIYINLGKVYRKTNKLAQSMEYLYKADSIYVKIDNPVGSASSLIQIGLTLLELGESEIALKKCMLGIDKAKQVGALEIVKQGYESLSKMYERRGMHAKALDAFKTFVVYKDSIYSIEKSKGIVRIQMQADFDRLMQNQKQEQEQKLTLAQGKSIKQTKIANIFILAFAITLSVFIVFFINNRQKQKQGDLLAFQKLDMERQKAELTHQRDELQIQKDLVIHQRDRIMAMLTDLGESIDYARKIQQALLPSDKELQKLLGDYFLFFQPRESVGGDFYWVAQNDQTIFFAVADCTGHGVPGGFMSMLGVSLLNELVSRSECTSPAKMLWTLRELIIKALSQTGLDEDSQDGMDIALCLYNPQNHHLVYAGANLSLFLVTSTPPVANEKVIVQGNIVELKPDRMPVSYYLRMIEFTEHHIVLNPGDCLYLSSDGFSDQFGGPNNKKFGYTAFRNLIQSVSIKPLDKQKDILWNEFDKWKGEENQTDDVIVMGVKIS